MHCTRQRFSLKMQNGGFCFSWICKCEEEEEEEEEEKDDGENSRRL
jgi:hypothetical protein